MSYIPLQREFLGISSSQVQTFTLWNPDSVPVTCKTTSGKGPFVHQKLNSLAKVQVDSLHAEFCSMANEYQQTFCILPWV